MMFCVSLSRQPEGFVSVNPRVGGWVAGTLAVSLFAIGCTQAKKPVDAGIAWNKAYDAALADAQTNHRPILLDFYTDW